MQRSLCVLGSGGHDQAGLESAEGHGDVGTDGRPVDRSGRGRPWCCPRNIDLRQNGVTCLAGTSSGRLYDTETRYQRIRDKTREMNERYAAEFGSQMQGARPVVE